MKAYLDTVIVSGLVRCDLRQHEMAASRELVERADRGELELVTSRLTWREQDRAKLVDVRDALKQARGDVAVVPEDSRILGFNYQDEPYTFIASPMLTNIVDEALFAALRGATLAEADAEHVMLAVHNGCDRFVTTDDKDLLPKRDAAHPYCRGLLIVWPTELIAELKPTR
jgi:predicted nucleic acid-binding protein